MARWRALGRVTGRLRAGQVLEFGDLRARVDSVEENGDLVVDLSGPRPAAEMIEAAGRTPLPPYIRRPHGPSAADRARYQTVYARQPGAVAAPTAGLHLTEDLLRELDGKGVRRAAVTLHVGPGTFRPVESEEADAHRMDEERYRVSPETAEAVRSARARGGRVVAVGTTTVRALETAARETGAVDAREGRTGLFIRPGFEFRVVDAILTNFHLPRSTLMMMICAFAGRERVLAAYAEAVRSGYRFYSFGDCMLIA